MKARSESVQPFCMDVLTAIVKDEVRVVQEKAGINGWLISRCGWGLEANIERSNKALKTDGMKLYLILH